ncbi:MULTISPECIES: hypothetical protein [Rhodococcus]|uniref:Uncharacterized protein n=1 Tax=Rhodococcus globerulus TaxID=33008 RepID=A0ABU4BQS2_RHOGO|nr:MULTISPECIES: hypothetical protein [Rhodococcus]MDV6266524.1 hypothetical protein [Rhodococcus globerulus]QXW04654.1 hypothetical protein KYT97_11890 [Rhodococcus globerulus]
MAVTLTVALTLFPGTAGAATNGCTSVTHLVPEKNWAVTILLGSSYTS